MMNPALEKIHVSGSVQRSDESEVLICGVKQIESELEGLTVRTESEFLSIGEKLSAFHHRATRLSEVSANVAAQMSGPEIAGAIDGLNGLMAKMEDYLDCSETETRTRVDQLRKILELIEVMYKPLEDFRRLAKSFRTISVTACIHYALILTKNNELQVLFDEVRELSGSIAGRVESMLDCVRSVRNTLEESLLKLLLFEGKQQGEARSILDSAESVICAVTEKYGFATALARHIADCSKEISYHAGAIVTSVQFHDINSQKLEKVKLALNGLAESSLALPRGQTYVWERENMSANIAAGTVDCCRQQVFELAGIRDTFFAAVNGITGDLTHISGNIANMSSDIKKIACNGDANRRTFLYEMGDLLSSITGSFEGLAEKDRASRDISTTLLFISNSIIEMSEFISDIDEIADDMQLLAFNAEIKTSQIGENGASFEVVALRIRELSAETCVQTKLISEELRKIASLSEDLSAGIIVHLEYADEEIEGISTELGKLMNSLSAVNRNLCSYVTEIDEAGCSLYSDIVRFAKGIHVHILVDTIVNRAIGGLNEIVANAGLQLPGNGNNRSAWHGYAINISPGGQNKAEGRHFAANELMPGDEVKPKSDGRACTGGGSAEEFGDNVELFI